MSEVSQIQATTYPQIVVEAGEVLYEDGATGQDMYLLHSGSVELLEPIAGDLKQVAVLERGDFFGEMSLLEGSDRSETVRALRRTVLVQIDANRFQHLLQRNPEITVRMIRKLGRRLSRVEQQLIAVLENLVASGEGVEIQNAKRRARLLLLDTDESIDLPSDREVTIGRGDAVQGVQPDVDLTDCDQRFSVSRRHARVFRLDGDIFLVEEHSTNGTYLNGERLMPGQARRLEHGDHVNFGAVPTRVEIS